MRSNLNSITTNRTSNPLVNRPYNKTQLYPNHCPNPLVINRLTGYNNFNIMRSKRSVKSKKENKQSANDKIKSSDLEDKEQRHQHTSRCSHGRSSSKPMDISPTTSSSLICSGCNKLIKKDKFVLKACDKYWHESCLRCDKCQSKLAELGNTLYCKSNMHLCRQDYLK